MLTIATVQIKNSTNTQGNFATILNFLKLFETQEVDLILFPECALSGFSAAIKDCTAEALEIYFKQIEEWSRVHQKDVILPTAMVEENKNFNSGFHFQQGRRQRFYKVGLTESEVKFFSTPQTLTPKVFECKGFKFALLICIEAEHPAWTYFKPTEADFILWPGYWGWEPEDDWSEHKKSKKEENLIYKNMQEWQLPLIQANFAYNHSTDPGVPAPTGPKGLSVVVDKENNLVTRGELEQESYTLVKVDKLGRSVSVIKF